MNKLARLLAESLVDLRLESHNQLVQSDASLVPLMQIEQIVRVSRADANGECQNTSGITLLITINGCELTQHYD